MAEAKKSKGDQDRELSKELVETFPASDPPAITQPGGGVTGPEVVAVDDGRMQKIRERAYAIWLDEGQCHDRDQAHWRQAERED